MLAVAVGALAVAAPHLFPAVTDRGWGEVESAYGEQAAQACEGVRAGVKARVAEIPSIIGTHSDVSMAIREMAAELQGCLNPQETSSESDPRLSLMLSDPGFPNPRIVTYVVESPPVAKTD